VKKVHSKIMDQHEVFNGKCDVWFELALKYLEKKNRIWVLNDESSWQCNVSVCLAY